MIKKCCYCKKFIGVKRPFLDLTITHSICRKHFKEIIWKIILDKNKKEIKKGEKL